MVLCVKRAYILRLIAIILHIIIIKEMHHESLLLNLFEEP